jgi:hypothetical protein
MENIMRLDRSEITSKHKITLPFFALDDRLDKIRKKKKMALNYIFIEQ